MKPIKIYRVKCNRFRFVNPKSSYIFDKTLIFSFIDSKYGDDNDRLFKEEQSNETLKILRFIK